MLNIFQGLAPLIFILIMWGRLVSGPFHRWGNWGSDKYWGLNLNYTGTYRQTEDLNLGLPDTEARPFLLSHDTSLSEHRLTTVSPLTHLANDLDFMSGSGDTDWETMSGALEDLLVSWVWKLWGPVRWIMSDKHLLSTICAPVWVKHSAGYKGRSSSIPFFCIVQFGLCKVS